MKIIIALLFMLFAAVRATDCDAYNTNQATCLKSTGTDGVKCAYCTSGAVGSECINEDDAMGLPSSVFRCTYQTAQTASKTTNSASGCEAQNKDKTTCLETKEGSEKCAYCTSGAVGSECVKESEAKGLPASVFSCVF